MYNKVYRHNNHGFVRDAMAQRLDTINKESADIKILKQDDLCHTF
ncbi:hypothetical protein NIES4071_75660 [Calothrix sp. NIES-4071]|nr:hypothetical protein NIES4071_75660 [Calothrix sp. NIES-4071]BAZ61841.1 hypothetical protein NIES4105_75610 [Calothrix sp. NIES-4105]